MQSPRPQDLLSPSSATASGRGSASVSMRKSSIHTYTIGCESGHPTTIYVDADKASQPPWGSVSGLATDCRDPSCDDAPAWPNPFYSCPEEGDARLAVEVLIKNGGEPEPVPTALMSALRHERGETMARTPVNMIWAGPETLAPSDNSGPHSKWLTSNGKTLRLHLSNPSEQVVKTAARYRESLEPYPFSMTNYVESAVPHVSIPAPVTQKSSESSKKDSRSPSRGRGAHTGSSGSRTRHFLSGVAKGLRSKSSSGDSSPSRRIVPVYTDRSGSSGTPEVHGESSLPPQLSSEGGMYESGGSSVPHELIGDHPSTAGRIQRRGAVRSPSSSQRTRLSTVPTLPRRSTNLPQTMQSTQGTRPGPPITEEEEDDEDEDEEESEEEEEEDDGADSD